MPEYDITYYESKGSVYLIGGFNSRIGDKKDFVVFDSVNHCFDEFDYVPDYNMERASIDKNCNIFETKLLDLCRSNDLRVANGRLGNDFNIGSFTYVAQHGASVIDYLLIKDTNFSSIRDFTIHSVNEWSDHTPISFSLLCNNITPVVNESSHVRYNWKSDYVNTFRTSLIAKLPDFNRITGNIDSTSRSSINDALNSFTFIIRGVADSLFSKTVYHKNDNTSFSDTSHVKDADWFDNECKNLRTIYLDSLYAYNTCKTKVSREYFFCKCKKEYKLLVRKKKNSYLKKKCSEMEKTKVL